MELNSVASKEYNPERLKEHMDRKSGSLTQTQYVTRKEVTSLAQKEIAKQNKKSQEANTLSFILNGRNQLFMEPFDVFDPHHPLRGKKRFNSNFRPLRSKINLNIGGEAVDLSKKKNNKVTVK